MRFRLVWVGKTRDPHYRALQDDYLQRLSHFVRCSVDEVRESSTEKNLEGKRILEKVNPTSFVCVLDVAGTGLTSHGLAREVERWQSGAVKEIVFVIGGADGVSEEVAARGNIRLSLSFLTFTHELARVVLLEQLYRAFTIIKGYPYQR